MSYFADYFADYALAANTWLDVELGLLIQPSSGGISL